MEICSLATVKSLDGALFTGSDGGGEPWAILASLIEICKLNAIDNAGLPHRSARAPDGRHPINRIGKLLPWLWKATPDRCQYECCRHYHSLERS